jgi:hypothetical protein
VLQRLYVASPLGFSREAHLNQKENTMSKSIKSNLKTITNNSVSIPMEAAATTLELASDVSDLALSTVRGAIPTTKRLGNIVGMFVTGVFNSEMDEHEVKKLYDETTLETVFAKIEETSLKAGQGLVKAWNNEETTPNSDK